MALISLAAQHSKSSAQFFVFDCSAPDSAEAKFLEHAVRVIPHEIKLVRAGDVDEVMATLAAQQQQRADDPGAATSETYLLIHGLQRNKKLRFDEEMSFSLDAGAGGNPGLQLNKLICEGASLGFYVIANCDSYNNVMRFLSRKALSEFEMRVVFQMSANDSASLIDSSQANHLGLHRAILFNGHEGWLETFRPYALPDERWLEEVRGQLGRLHLIGVRSKRLHLPTSLGARLTQRSEKSLPILVIPKNLLAPVAAIHHTCPAVAPKFSAKGDGKSRRDIPLSTSAPCR